MAPDKVRYIYCLRCPISEEIRYVGCTIHPALRLKEHCADTSGSSGNRAAWVGSLKKEGHVPVMEILDEVEETTWREDEMAWIEWALMQGYPLTNRRAGYSMAVLPYMNRLREIVEQSGREHWSLPQLCRTLQVHERTARRYLDQFGMDIVLLVRPKQKSAEAQP